MKSCLDWVLELDEQNRNAPICYLVGTILEHSPIKISQAQFNSTRQYLDSCISHTLGRDQPVIGASCMLTGPWWKSLLGQIWFEY